MGWISFALGVMGAASGVLQAVMLAGMPPLRTMLGAAFGPEGIAVPPALAWMLDHMQALNAASLLLSAAFAWVSWELVQRRERGRRPGSGGAEELHRLAGHLRPDGGL